MTIKWSDADEETFAEERAAAEAMREVDDEIAARLRGRGPVLVIRIELWPHGDETRRKTVASGTHRQLPAQARPPKATIGWS